MIGIYHLSLFALRPGGRGALYFGLICLLIVLRVLLRGERVLVQLWPDLDWELLVRLEYVGLYLLLPASVAFINNGYRRLVHPLILKFLYLFSFLLVSSAIVLPVRWSSHLVPLFQLILLGGTCYGLVILFIAAWRRYSGAFFIFGGLVSLVVASVVDIAINRFHIQMMEWLPFALFGLAVGQTLRMSRGFQRALDLARAMRDELEHTVRQRTAQLERERQALQNSSQEAARTRDALWGEMQVAYKIQTMLLPRNPVLPGYEVIGSMMPASEVGGDYYDVIQQDGRVWLAIGDVAGHGIPAGLIMMMARTALRSLIQSQPDRDVDEILAAVNRILYADIQKISQTRYMTLSLLCISEATIRYAGLHLDFLIHRAADHRLERIATQGMWLGVMEEIGEYLEVGTIELQADDTLFLFTDGIIESFSPEGSMYGQERLERIFLQYAQSSLTEIHQTLIADLNHFRCNDDITLLLMKRTAT